MTVHLIKLVVGLDTLDDFADWQKREARCVKYDGKPANTVHTRNRPKQEDEILKSGGSIYRVIKGKIRCRQQIIGFDDIRDDDGKKYCLIYTDPKIIETYNMPFRPFQGWRYLKPADVPPDTGAYKKGRAINDIPPEIAQKLRDVGLL